MTTTVVVPTHQRRAAIVRLCDALTRQTAAPSSFELVVSIDGSTDGTREALAELATPYPLRVLWQPNRGRAAAVNAGVAAASGELVVLLDDDMEPVPAFIEAHRRAHAAGERVGVMGAVPITIDAALPAAARYMARTFNDHLEKLQRSDYSFRLTDFYSGNFSIRRRLLEEAGGFDEDFQLYGNEDLELSYRLARAGVRLRYDAGACARQYNDKSFDAVARDSVAAGRTAVLFAQKHPEVFDQLKLGSFHEGPLPLRLVRNGLLAIGHRATSLPDAIRVVERALARLRPAGVSPFYRLALGYFYWTGVRAALAEHPRHAEQAAGLHRLARELSP